MMPNKNKSNITTFKILAIFLLISIVFVMVVGLASKAKASCDVNCSSCSDCMNKMTSVSIGQTVCLNTSITNQVGNCINDPDDFMNKVFDCQGHSISGDNSGDHEYGIYLDGKTSNTIKNCVITGFNDGVYLSYSSGNTINSSNISNNDYGIKLVSSDNNVISHNSIISNIHAGMELHYSSNNDIKSNSIKDNGGDGIFLDLSSDNNNMSYNIINKNSIGIDLYSSNDNILTNNGICGNDYDDVLNQSGIGSGVGNIGNDNACDSVYNWADEGITNGCTYNCAECTQNSDCTYLESCENGIYHDYFCDSGSCVFNINIDCTQPLEGDSLYETSAKQDCCNSNCGAYGESTETTCNDGIDNDCDGLTDNNDTDCVVNQDITSCQSILASGTYNLTQNIIDSDNQTCINIAADNVVLDCQGHKVYGDGHGVNNINNQTYGIYSSGHNNITIKNCKIAGWYHGVYLQYSKSHKIINNAFGDILFNLSGNYEYINNSVAVHLANVNDSLIKNNIVSYSGWSGIIVYKDNYSRNNTVVGNRVTKSGANGIYLWRADESTVHDNTITDTYNGDGIYLKNATSNHVFNNSVTNSRNEGLHIEGSESINNNISDNLFCYNRLDIYTYDFNNNLQSNIDGGGNICDNRSSNWYICTSPCPTQVTLTASWSSPEIEIGDPVNATAEAQNVNDGESVNFKIYKHRCSHLLSCDGGGTTNAIRTFFGYITGYVIGSCVDDLVNQSIVDLSKGVASYEWTPTQISDDTNLCNYYFFTATLDGKTAISGQLEVFKKGQLPNRPPVARITLPSQFCDSKSSNCCKNTNTSNVPYYQYNTPIKFNQTSYDPDGYNDLTEWYWNFSDGPHILHVSSTLVNMNTTYTYKTDDQYTDFGYSLFTPFVHLKDEEKESEDWRFLTVVNCSNLPHNLPPLMEITHPTQHENVDSPVNFKVKFVDPDTLTSKYTFYWTFVKDNSIIDKVSCSTGDCPNITESFPLSGEYEAILFALNPEGNEGTFDVKDFYVNVAHPCYCEGNNEIRACGTCFSSKPDYCASNGNVVNNASFCGCPPEKYAQANRCVDASLTCNENNDITSCNNDPGCYWDECKSCEAVPYNDRSCSAYSNDTTCWIDPCDFKFIDKAKVQSQLPNWQYVVGNGNCAWDSNNGECYYNYSTTGSNGQYACQKRVEVLQECTDVIHERRVNETYWINETGGWQLDDKGKCGQSQVKTITCPQTPGQQLPFFDWRNVIAVVLILAGYYSFMLAKRKNKKLKVSKRR